MPVTKKLAKVSAELAENPGTAAHESANFYLGPMKSVEFPWLLILATI